ncbi:MAG: hypothetical protein WBA64_16780 [Marinomonas sp.]
MTATLSQDNLAAALETQSKPQPESKKRESSLVISTNSRYIL